MTANQINFARLKEEHRANVVKEDQGWFNAGETQRSNLAKEDINWFNADTDRAYKQGMVGIGWANAGANQLQAQSSWKNAETAARRLDEVEKPESEAKVKLTDAQTKTEGMKYSTLFNQAAFGPAKVNAETFELYSQYAKNMAEAKKAGVQAEMVPWETFLHFMNTGVDVAGMVAGTP